MNTNQNIFENAKFGDKYVTRDGRLALYLSTEHGGTRGDRDNPPFLIIHVAVEHHVKYADGSEKRFHSVGMYHESGKFNKWNPEDDDRDIVGRWVEPVDESTTPKIETKAWVKWIEEFEEGSDDWRDAHRILREYYERGYDINASIDEPRNAFNERKRCK